jgi:hypothetical protein
VIFPFRNSPDNFWIPQKVTHVLVFWVNLKRSIFVSLLTLIPLLFLSIAEEYQDLIEDIVRDGRLYSSHQHREVLKVCHTSVILLDIFTRFWSLDNKYSLMTLTAEIWGNGKFGGFYRGIVHSGCSSHFQTVHCCLAVEWLVRCPHLMQYPIPPRSDIFGSYEEMTLVNIWAW